MQRRYVGSEAREALGCPTVSYGTRIRKSVAFRIKEVKEKNPLQRARCARGTNAKSNKHSVPMVNQNTDSPPLCYSEVHRGVTTVVSDRPECSGNAMMGVVEW